MLKVSYSKFILNENPVKLFGFAFLIVSSGSMEPEIKTGELIIIKDKLNYEKGDVVTFFDKDGFLTTHRIVEDKDNILTTKGDSNDIEDEAILKENIVGKLVIHSKILGFFVYYLLKPLVFLYVMFWLCLIIYENFFIRENLKNGGENES